MSARLLAGFLTIFFCFAALALSQTARAGDDGDVLRAVVAQVNAVRTAQGLAPVAADERLTAAAAAHSSGQAAMGRLSHDGFAARMQALGPNYGFVAENVAAGQPTPAAVVEAWMHSPTHRDNLLQPSISVVGVARAGSFWTLILAQRV